MGTRRCVASLGLCTAALGPNTSAQETPIPEGFAVVIGIAVDSIRGGFLRDATVSLSNTNRRAITDSTGEFKFDSVGSGTYSLRLSHPLLDTIGLSIVTRPTELKAGTVTSFTLAVPSAATIVGRKCSATDRELGSAALTGVVLDADTEMPSVGAEVIVAWTDYSVGKTDIQKTPQRRVSKVGADGGYLVCGIPADLATGVMAIRSSDSTAAMPVSFSNGLVIQSFHLPPPVVSSETGARGVAVLTGRVVGPGGNGIAGARVALEDDRAAVISDANGGFRLSGLRAGTRLLTVRKLGYEASELPVELSSLSPKSLIVTVSPVTNVLETVRVSAMRDLSLQRVGFTDRKRAGMGYYITPQDIQRRNPLRLNHLLETVIGLRRRRTADGKDFITGTRACVRYFVDGRRWFTGSETDIEMVPDRYLSAADLGAIEVYGGIMAPGEFLSADRNGLPCTSVVIWTKWKLRM